VNRLTRTLEKSEYTCIDGSTPICKPCLEDAVTEVLSLKHHWGNRPLRPKLVHNDAVIWQRGCVLGHAAARD
jgi:hypothetical protein